jgi:hypothetical protein
VDEPRTDGASPARLHRVFSFPAALAALLLMLAVLTIRDRFEDPDMWWHLKTGQIIWTTHHIPTTDLFSYTTNHHAWIPHEWLSELFIYAMYAARGYSGLMLWECGLTAAILLAGFYFCSLYSGSPKLGFLGGLVIWFFGTVGFAVRPHMVGYLLLLVELFLLHLGRTRNPRWFILLPPMFALWVNCHGLFMLGLFMAGAYLATALVRRGTGSVIATQWTSAATRTLAVALAASVPALLLNPVGIKLILYPFTAVVAPSLGVAVVSEWQPLVFNEVRSFAIVGLLALVIFLPAVSRAKLFVHELVLLVLGTYLALSHQRLLFVFGILAAPTIARVLAELWDDKRSEQQHPIANAVLIALSFAVAFLAFPSAANLDAQVQRFSPVRAVDYVRSHQLSGPMLNDWGDGGYLIWAMPEHPVFIDGRSDVYEWSGALAEYFRWATITDPPDQLLDKYHVHFCLFRRESYMATVVSLLPNWRRVYSDEVSTIFVRTD